MAGMTSSFLYTSILLVIVTAVKLSQGASYSDELRLMERLGNASYSPHIRPVLNGSSPVHLKFGVALVHFKIDSNTMEAQTDVWYTLTWTDELTKWDPSEFGGITLIRGYPIDKLWVPDIKTQNSQEPVETWDRTPAILYNDGTVMWVPRARVITKCRRDHSHAIWNVRYHCPYKFGSWVLSDRQMTMGLYMDRAKMDTVPYDIVYNDYDVKENKMEIQVSHYECCEEGYVTANATLTFQKKSIF